jgi:hypothetical protein
MNDLPSVDDIRTDLSGVLERFRAGSTRAFSFGVRRGHRHVTDEGNGISTADRPVFSGGNQVQRQAELDAQRAVAHAWAGQQPLASSRPLDAAHFGGRRQRRSGSLARVGSVLAKGRARADSGG